MSDEVREAAERLRMHMAEPNHRDTYHGTTESLIGDWATLGRAYLAEHPADDGQAIGEDWLRSVGGMWNPDAAAFVFRYHRLSLWIRANGQAWMDFDSRECGRCGTYGRYKTRGDVRRLCAALGIELKEASNG